MEAREFAGGIAAFPKGSAGRVGERATSIKNSAVALQAHFRVPFCTRKAVDGNHRDRKSADMDNKSLANAVGF